ncbi:MAG: hypothetical protein KDI04_01540 [Halieaceae bacterium]|nr:hypothetical protein [Halieaceae bacterium]
MLGNATAHTGKLRQAAPRRSQLPATLVYCLYETLDARYVLVCSPGPEKDHLSVEATPGARDWADTKTMTKILPALLPLLLALPCLAQTTCYTDPQGTTLCSTPDEVIRGNTNSIGQSVYRDDRGHQLDYEVDQFGNATVQPLSGKPVDWSQSVPAGRANPAGNSRWQPLPGSPVRPVLPGNTSLSPPGDLPGQR